jgi:tetratricopeptide (TPR) repeat protein
VIVAYRFLLPSLLLLLFQPAFANGQPAKKKDVKKEEVEKNATPTPVFNLWHIDEESATSPGNNYNILLREMARQAVLLAARDEMGYRTRDSQLGEVIPPSRFAKNRFKLTTSFELGGTYKCVLLNDITVNAREIWRAEDDLPVRINLVEWLEQWEKASRTEIPKALRAEGFKGSAHPWTRDVAVPGKIADRLQYMDVLTQFQAAQELHALVQVKGESTPILGALVRAYSHLGILTEHHWGIPQHKIFRARALLYAQRLIARDPEHPDSYWHRGYAMALTGLHDAAMKDFARAKELERDFRTRVSVLPGRPDWVPFLESFCSFDLKGLAKDPPQQHFVQLSRLLYFLAAEDETTVQFTLDAAKRMLDINPQCYRVHDGAANVGGVASQHSTTQAGLEAFAKHFMPSLARLPNLPPKVADLLAKGAPEPDIVAALVDTADDADIELTWQLLAQLIVETRFSLIMRRATFMNDGLAVPSREYVEQLLPLYARHPFSGYLRTIGHRTNKERDDLTQQLLNLPRNNYQFTQLQMILRLQRMRWPETDARIQLMMGSTDQIYRDAQLMLPVLLQGEQRIPVSRVLLKLSPNAPLAQAKLIGDDWPYAKKFVDTWAITNQHPHFWRALGERMSQLGDHDAAKRYLEKAIAQSPDLVTFIKLAESYKAQNQMDKWQATLERVLEQEDTALNHAKVRAEIANEYMRRKDFKKALPFAERAAQSGAEWALLTAARAYEGLGQWDKAEQMVSAASGRYGSSRFEWLTWCVKNGRGDRKAAADLVVEQTNDFQNATILDEARVIQFYLMAERKEKLLEILNRLNKDGQLKFAPRFVMALICDELGQKAERDRHFKEGFPGDRDYWCNALVDQIRATLAKGEKAKLDLDKINDHIRMQQRPRISECCFLIAWYLENHGQKDAAAAYWKRAQVDYEEPQHRSFFIPLLAADRLRARPKGNAK